MKYIKALATNLAERKYGVVDIQTPLKLAIAALVTIALVACSDSVENRDAPPDPRSTALVIGDDPEVINFVDTVWTPIFRQYTCKGCHVYGDQLAFADPNAARALSAAQTIFHPANGDPADNEFVTRVAGLHGCWTNDCSNDRNELEAALVAWQDAYNNGGSLDDNVPPPTTPNQSLENVIYTTPSPAIPFERVADIGLNDDGTGYFTSSTGTAGNRPADSLYDLVREHCSECHDSTTTQNTPQQPYFADVNPVVAYNSIVSASLVKLGNPGGSNLVKRLHPGQHNCWSGVPCPDDAAEIQARIAAWADDRAQGVQPVFDPELTPSGALTLNEGQVTSGGARFDSYVVAKYEFSEGADNDSSNDRVATDSSNVIPALNLQLFGDVTWVGGYGIRIGAGGQARSVSVAASQKLHDALVAQDEYSIEAWIIPDNTAQEGAVNINSAVVATYSSGASNRNVTMGQETYHYTLRNRSSVQVPDPNNPQNMIWTTDPEGTELRTPDGDNTAQTILQHVVMTYSPISGKRIFVNGELVVNDATPDAGRLNGWDTDYLLSLGSDTNGNNQWLGIIKFFAIHRKELTQAEILTNFDAGVGQKFNLLFNISGIPNVSGVGPNSYIWFEAAIYDDFSYLFSQPKYVDLGYADATPPTVNFSFRGLRIGVNGAEPSAGQAFARLGKTHIPNDATQNIDVTSPNPASLVRLHGEKFNIAPPASGTVIPVDVDFNTDEFFLTFEHIGGIDEAKVRGTTTTGTLPFDYAPGDQYVVGLRTFDEINASMSALTGVEMGAVSDDYIALKGQLPADEGISGFLPSHQTAIASLAGAYCTNRVEDVGIDPNAILTAEEYFGVDTNPAIDFQNSTVQAAFGDGSGGVNIDRVASAIVNRMVRDVNTLVEVTETTETQPVAPADPAVEITTELKSLAGYLLGEGDPTTRMATPHACNAEIPDCTTNARMKSIVKAMCTAVLASAVVTHQ